MLEPAELALHGSTLDVKLAVSLALARDQRVQPVGFAPHTLSGTLAGRTAPLGSAALVVGPGELPLACAHQGGSAAPRLTGSVSLSGMTGAMSRSMSHLCSGEAHAG